MILTEALRPILYSESDLVLKGENVAFNSYSPPAKTLWEIFKWGKEEVTQNTFVNIDFQAEGVSLLSSNSFEENERMRSLFPLISILK